MLRRLPFPTLFDRILDLLAPDVCSVCEGPADGIPGWCARCLGGLPWHPFERCAVCGTVLIGRRCPACAREPWSAAYTVLRYEAPVTGLVGKWKFGPDPGMSRGLAAVFEAAVGPRARRGDRPLVVPVPQSAAAWRTRGFSPALDLARAMVRATGGRMTHSLTRAKQAGPQVGLTARERSRNVRGLFRVPARNQARVRGRRVLLVDDVVTTGATARECARCLGDAGAADVVVAALARADRP